MIHIFVGTKAQFIKMVPIMLELNKRGIPYNYVDAGQHAELTKKLQKIFKIPEPSYSLNASYKDITRISKAIIWFVGNITKSILNRKWLRTYVFPNNGLCLIHGDTLSTLLGALMAILAGVKICHVEAGLRSYNYIDPFPEEIIRLICMRYSKILFAPSQNAFENLENLKVKGEKYIIRGNTVIDAIRYIEKIYGFYANLNGKYAVATCHRLETISDRNKMEKVINLLNKIAKKMHVIFVVHKPTMKYIKKFRLDRKISKNIKIKNMLDYPQFISLIIMSEMVLTDGGSIQEECAYLNKKCLIIRNATERSDGIGKNAMLWRFDENNTDKFLSWDIGKSDKLEDKFYPSKDIVDHLVRLNLLQCN